ncbi:MAG: hypothetical protein ACUVQ6_02040 [Dissulfurimicrobium sp.]|uniref:hypothetical protein n=1 Tax=Dissulfurimicrobium sp. TaxID=2022436 RepID=UPI00404B288C
MTYRTSVIRMSQRQAYGTFGKRDILIGSTSRDLRLSLREILAAALAFFIFSLNLWSGYEIRSISNDVVLLERDKAQLDARSKILNEIDAQLRSPERLGQMAQKLGFHKPEGHQIVRLED